MDIMKKHLPWIVITVTLVIIFGTIYGVAQQALRYDANYPQIQLADDTVASLNSGANPINLIGGNVNANSSLAPFIVIYDKLGEPVASSGLLNGKLPIAPFGILKAAEFSDYRAITWQPQANLRFAAVTVAANKYYVLSARSLKEVEKNETKSLELAFIGGLGALVFLKVAYLFSGQTSLKFKK